MKLETPPLHKRRIMLEDKRYLIFYTFGQRSEAATDDNTTNKLPEAVALPAPTDAQPLAEER